MTNKKPQSTNAVIYARVSPRKNTVERNSCEVQIETCRNYCKFKGWDVIGVYRDDYISGKSTKNRTGLQDAMSKAITKNAHIVSYSLSRLTRSVKDAFVIIDNLRNHDLGFVSCKEGYDTSTYSGRGMLGILASVAEMQREATSEQTSDKLHWMMDQGIRVSALPPWGSQIDPADSKRVVKNHTEVAMMRRIMAWRESGEGLRAICKLLDEAGIKPRKTWSKAEGVFKPSKWHHYRITQILARCNQLDL